MTKTRLPKQPSKQTRPPYSRYDCFFNFTNDLSAEDFEKFAHIMINKIMSAIGEEMKFKKKPLKIKQRAFFQEPTQTSPNGHSLQLMIPFYILKMFYLTCLKNGGSLHLADALLSHQSVRHEMFLNKRPQTVKKLPHVLPANGIHQDCNNL